MCVEVWANFGSCAGIVVLCGVGVWELCVLWCAAVCVRVGVAYLRCGSGGCVCFVLNGCYRRACGWWWCRVKGSVPFSDMHVMCSVIDW